MSWPGVPMHWVMASLTAPGCQPGNGGNTGWDSRSGGTSSVTGAGR